MSESVERGVRKSRVGVVVSDAMDKTRVVRVERRVRHPLYRKEVKKAKKFYVHDETNETRVGDRVRIVEMRPLSKTKRWRIESVVEKAPEFK